MQLHYHIFQFNHSGCQFIKYFLYVTEFSDHLTLQIHFMIKKHELHLVAMLVKYEIELKDGSTVSSVGRSQGRISPGAWCCVLEQDTSCSLLILVQPRKNVPK